MRLNHCMSFKMGSTSGLQCNHKPYFLRSPVLWILKALLKWVVHVSIGPSRLVNQISLPVGKGKWLPCIQMGWLTPRKILTLPGAPSPAQWFCQAMKHGCTQKVSSIGHFSLTYGGSLIHVAPSPTLWVFAIWIDLSRPKNLRRIYPGAFLPPGSHNGHGIQ